jgi:TRAP-type C4-dicarboxylate transport system permease small subunit
MSTFYQLLAIVGAGLLVWFTYRTIKNRPGQFSREKMSHSFLTMGVLGLILIAFVTLLVLFVRT